MGKIAERVRQDEVKLTDAEKLFVKRLSAGRDHLARRYPLVFAGAAAFGLVSTYYGFEKLIDRSEVLVDNPWILLSTGLVVLVVTGTVYTKL
ncbi:hypothetical protein KC878_04030 [Candidatus Saccharibacteria bacterium]|nr:hypothetical protein [Candidatus Saccharibacteria bacterium]MCB9821016.1 hypothetical protein [Candidatus Nomurabacteria bacterium]